MKKEEQQFLKKYLQKSNISPNFSDIQEKISYPEKAKKKRNKYLVPVLSFASFAVLILGLSIGLSFLPSSVSKGNSTPNQSLALYEDVYLDNEREIQTIYERNLSFVEDGFSFAKEENNGRITLLESEIDSSSFQEGIPGEYPIHLSLKEENIQETLLVEVIEEEVETIDVHFDKGFYYLGETPLPSDFSLKKLRSDGSSIAAKESEYALEYDEESFSSLGKKNIRVYLKGNASIYVDMVCEVKPLEEISFAGNYGWVADDYPYGAPLIKMFHISENNEISSDYSEIWMEGELTIEKKGDILHLSTPSTSTQLATYNPNTRIFEVEGVAGDPPYPCFLLPSMTHEIHVLYPLDINREDVFCAKNGYLDQSTLNTIIYFGGGVYLDSEFKNEVTRNTYLEDGCTIYGGTIYEHEYDGVLSGIWVDEERDPLPEVSYVFKEDKVSYQFLDFLKDYSVSRHGNGLFIRFANQVLRYDIRTDQIEIFGYQGKVASSYRRFDDEEEIIVRFAYLTSSEHAFVLKKGEKMSSYMISKNGEDIYFYDFDDYEGQPLYENTKLTGTLGNIGLRDFLGTYGTYKDYWQTDNLASFEEGVSYSSYAFVHYQNLELVDYGKLSIVGYKEDTHEVLISCSLKSGTTLNLIGKSFSFFFPDENDHSRYNKNEHLYADLPFLGTYVSESGKTFLIKDNETFQTREIDSTGYEWDNIVGYRLTKEEENSFLLTYQEVTGYGPEDYENRTLTISFVDGFYELTYRDITYRKSI